MTAQSKLIHTTDDLNQFENYVAQAVAVLANELTDSQAAGVLHLRSPDGVALLTKPIGGPAAEKVGNFSFFAAEKTERLYNHKDHILSWQTLDISQKKYQGAVKAPNGYVASFSGLSGEDDEALALWGLVQMGWMTDQDARQAAAISGNERQRDLFQAFKIAD